MDREDLGYSDFFEEGRKRVDPDSSAVARVVAEHRGSYRVMRAAGECTAKVTGAQMFKASSGEDYPAIGDWVAVIELNAEQAVIRNVLPRRTVLKRKESGGSGAQVLAANIDEAYVVQAAGRDFNVNRIERYAAMIAAGGVQPGVILNKSDLVSREECDAMISRIKTRIPEVGVISASTVAEGGLDELAAQLMKGKTYCFVGSSGVGKSSLINKLLGKKILETRQISSRTGRGTHVTTARALFMLDGGAMVIDTPGTRELGMFDSDAGIHTVFDEIIGMAKSCKFSDCTHTNEPGCVVRAAIRSGTLDEKRYGSYEKLKKENEFCDMTNVEKRKKDRAFGKFIKKAKEQIERYT